MNEPDNFALVPRPPGALEKAKPGAERLLAGMVADTLALVKKEQARKTRPPRIFIVDDAEGTRGFCKLLLKNWFKEATLQEFENGDDAWKELSQTDPDLLITRMPTIGLFLLPLLAERMVKYPILVTSGFFSEDEVRERADPNLNVSFLPLPFTAQQFYEELLIRLGPSDNPQAQALETTPQPRNERAPRIIVVDDDDDWLKLMEAIIQDWFKDATVLMFRNGNTAWRELLRADPDLLITDIRRPTFPIEDMLPLLAKRNVKYPILILSGVGDKKIHRQLRERAGPHLNLTILTKPVNNEELEKHVRTLLAASKPMINE